MEKDFKKLKLNLLLYRHIYVIYAIIISIMTGFAVNSIIKMYPTWYIMIQISIIVLLIWIAIVKLPMERRNIRTKADIFLLIMDSIKQGLKSRVTNLIVLVHEFDDLKEKKDGIRIIQERIANIHISTIEESINAAVKLGGKMDEAFATSFSVPDTIQELERLILEMKDGAEKEQKEVAMMTEEIETLYDKF